MTRNYFFTSILTASIVMTGSVGFGQTRTVSKDGLKNHTHIQAAIGFFNPDPDPLTPNIIQVTDSAVYEEVVTVDVPVTIEGTGSSKPVLALEANINGRAASAGLVINLPSTISTGTVVLRNLTLIPSKSPATTPASCAVNVVNNNVFAFFDQVLITGNDGFDQPVSSSGLVNILAEPTHVNFGDDGIVAGDDSSGQFEGSGMELLLRNTIITHLRGTVTGTSDGIVTTGTANRTLRLVEGNILTAMNGKGMDVQGDFELNSLPNRTIIALNASFGIWFHDSPNFRNIRGAIIANNQVGIYESTNSGHHFTIEDSLLTNNARQNLRSSGLLNSQFTFRRTTISTQVGATYEPVRLDGTASTVLFEDCIIGGNGNVSTSNTITNLGSGQYTFVNSSLILGGPQCLTYPFYKPGFMNGAAVIRTDPKFLNTTDFTSPDYYDVSSPSYAALGTGNQPLKGGGDYTGPAAPGPVTPQIVTISKTSAANFATIQAAIDSLPLDATKAYMLQILDSSLYDEAINLKVPATIIGTGSSRPTLAVQPVAEGFDNEGTVLANSWSGDAGLLINIPDTVATGTVALKNLIIIPSRAVSPPPSAGIVSKHNNFYLDMENVLISGNNGTDQPISVDGLVQQPIDPAHVHFVAGGANLGSITNGRTEGDGAEIRLKNCVITHNRCPTTNLDGDLAFRCGLKIPKMYEVTLIPPGAGAPFRPNAYRWLRIEDGCVVTFNIYGIRSGAATEIDAPNQRLLVYGNRVGGIDFVTRKGKWINGLTVANNGQTGIAEQTGAIGPRMHMSNAVIANNGWYNLYFWQGAAAQTPAFLTNVTLANQSFPAMVLPPPPTLQPNLYTLTMAASGAGNNTMVGYVLATDCIFAGHGDTAKALNVINPSRGAGSYFRLEHSAVVTTGPRALIETPNGTGVLISNLGSLQGMPITNVDPVFLNTTDPTLPNFYAVASTAYATLASDGSPLSGGGQYLPSATVYEWSLY